MGLFDCDCVCAQPPDYSGVAQANEAAAKYAYQAANEDLAFRKQVYQDSLPRQQQLQDLATQVANQQLGISRANEDRAAAQWQEYQRVFRPQERLMASDALAAQYLTPAQRQQLIATLNDPNLTPAQRDQILMQLSTAGEQAAIDKIKADATAYEQLMQQRATGLYSREQQRAMQDELRARQIAEADINSSYAAQGRELARRGFNPARIAQAAASLAQQQALARVTAANQMYGLTAQRLRGAEDQANAIRWQGQDTAMARRQGAKEQVGSKYASLRAGAAAFGRNMPNTAGQAYGLATGAGTSAVGNQTAGFQSGLPYAQYVSQATGNQIAAAGVQQTGALGLGNLMSRDYATAQSGYNNMQSGGGFGELLGVGLQAAKFFI